MTTTTASRKDQLREWIETNPLRKWRKRHGLSMMDASATLDASMSSVQQWEQGATLPNDASMDKLAEAMALNPRTLRRSWREWYDARPGNTAT